MSPLIGGLRYFYKDRGYEHIEDRFLRNTMKALDHLHSADALTVAYQDIGGMKALGSIDVLIANTSKGIDIVYSEAKNYYKPSSNTVDLYDSQGVFFTKTIEKNDLRASTAIVGILLLWQC